MNPNKALWEKGDFAETVDQRFSTFPPRPFEVAKEMVRVTRPGGRIIIGNWIPNDPDPRRANIEDQRGLHAAAP